GDTSSSGSAAVGAAIALTFANHNASATTARPITATGTITFSALGASTATSSATASAAGAPAENSTDHASGETVDSDIAAERTHADNPSTATRSVGSDTTNTFGAQATSGAGGGKNSVAGSIAFNLVLAQSSASVGNGVAVTLSGGTRDVSITADPDSISTTKALSGGVSGAKFGLGLSIAVSVVIDRTTASIGNEAL